MTSQLSNPSLTQPYEGPDDIHLGDSSSLSITHIGSTSFSPSFTLSNILCVPSIHQNLISVSKFCRTNKPPLNFFLLIFLLRIYLRGCLCSAERDGMIFLNGQHPSLATPRLSTHVAPSLSPVTWHGRLGHPSSAILQSLVSSGLISLSTPLSSSFYCESYLCNKSQRLPFGLRV